MGHPPSGRVTRQTPSGRGLKVNSILVSKDMDMVDVLNNEFKSVFTIEEETNIAALQPQAMTENYYRNS